MWKSGRWLACQPLESAASFRPKEDLGDKILFTTIVILLVLIAGLMSGMVLSSERISKGMLYLLIRPKRAFGLPDYFYS